MNLLNSKKTNELSVLVVSCAHSHIIINRLKMLHTL